MFEVAFILVALYLSFRALRFWIRSPRFSSVQAEERESLRYQSLGRRLAALLVDVVLVELLSRGIRAIHIPYVPIAIPNAYPIVAVAFYGTTIGKRIGGLEVRMLDDSRAGWRAAFLRETPSLCCRLAFYALVFSVSTSPEPLNEQEMRALYEKPLHYLLLSVTALAIADITPALLSKNRRALHDRVAGTVVVRTEAS